MVEEKDLIKRIDEYLKNVSDLNYEYCNNQNDEICKTINKLREINEK